MEGGANPASMKAILATAALLAASPLAADEPTSEQTAETAEVIAAADAFFKALGSTRKTDLAEVMLPEGMIFVHNRMDPANPRVDIVPVARHLERWAGTTGRFIEEMKYETVLVNGDMAQVWGPYVFLANSVVSHCGINSLSMVKTADGTWKVANTSFTMERPSECKRLGAPGFDQ
ncbi:MAG: hypothetical protein C0471_16520 [Erythrobacter sp.]|nr:hypothetical protein [Erythrobacter sp.]